MSTDHRNDRHDHRDGTEPSAGEPATTRARRSPRRRRAARAVAGGAVIATMAAACVPGALDAGWSDDGFASAPTGSNRATAATATDDGKLVAAGTGTIEEDGTPAHTGVWAVRYQPDGTYDPSFGIDGLARRDVGEGAEVVRGVAVAPDGGVVVVGHLDGVLDGDDGDLFVVRFDAAGAPDADFGTDGVVVLDETDHDRAGGVAVVGERILVGAALDADGSWANQWTVLALGPDGSPDPTWATAGRATVPAGLLSGFDGLADLEVAPDGDLVLGGTSANQLAVTRLTPGGAPDPTFSGDGVATAAVANGGQGFDLAVQPDGRIVLVGFARQSGTRSDEDLAAVRFGVGGTPDPGFGGAGRVTIDMGAAANDRAHAVALAADGKIVLGGMTHAEGGMDSALVRLNHDGSPDASFDGDGRAVHDTHTGANEQLEALVVTATDRILGVGWNLAGWAVPGVVGGARTEVFAGDLLVSEGPVGPATAQVTLHLSQAVDVPVTVRWATADGDATAPADYLAGAGTATFPAGATTATVTVAVVKDAIAEDDEHFFVGLGQPTNARVAPGGGVVTIVDDD